MNKTQLWELVQSLLVEHKASKKLAQALEDVLKPKAGGGISQNPMKTIDGVNYHYCRYSAIYVVEDEMVLSNGKSKGYSKLAMSLWTKKGKEAQLMSNEALQLLMAGDIEGGTAKAKEAEQLKLDRNNPSSYLEVKSSLIEKELGIEA